MAMVLLGFRKLESWLVWMVADVIYIYFFFINSLYLSSGLYFIFLILSIYGYYNWKKQLKKQ
jgi:nicotinamide mononucleotide transporter